MGSNGEVEKRRAEVECHAVEMRPYAVPLGVSAASADPVLDPLSHLDGQQPGVLQSLALAAEARRGNDVAS